MENIVIHSDGGSRGNPGPAASAFLVEKGQEVLHKGSKYLGTKTNNFAEYTAVLMAINWLVENLKDLDNGNVLFLLDSELVVKQLKGEYQIKDSTLKVLYLEIKSLILKNNLEIEFKHVRREQNKEADFLVNQEMDNNLK